VRVYPDLPVLARFPVVEDGVAHVLEELAPVIFREVDESWKVLKDCAGLTSPVVTLPSRNDWMVSMSRQSSARIANPGRYGS
jgi:hypothetical protein